MMKCTYISVLAGFLLFTSSAYAEEPQTTIAPPYTIEECYQLTLDNSESLKIRDEQLKIAEANYKVALSQLFPQFSVRADYVNRDNEDFGRVSRGRDDGANPVGGNTGSLGRIQTASRAVVTQPLFNGFRDFLLSDAAEQESEAVNLNNIRAKELLFLDVSDLFYQIAFNEAELKVVDEARKTLQSRVNELRGFIDLGKSRESEVQAALSEVADMEAVGGRIRGLTKASKELLAFLTTVPSDKLVLEASLKKPVLGPVNDYIAASKDRSDLKSQDLLTKAQENRVTAAERERWPSINLLGNAYGPEDPDRNRDWHLLVEFSMPVFDWGRITARTEAEEARLKTVNLQTAERLRQIERDIRVAHSNTITADEQIKSLLKLKDAARKSYNFQKEDYKNGVVTNLEVLQSIRQLQEAERRLLLANAEYISNFNALKVATGGFVK